MTVLAIPRQPPFTGHAAVARIADELRDRPRLLATSPISAGEHREEQYEGGHPTRSRPPEPVVVQDDAAASAESTQVPDLFVSATTTRTIDAAKPAHHITSRFTRTSSLAADR